MGIEGVSVEVEMYRSFGGVNSLVSGWVWKGVLGRRDRKIGGDGILMGVESWCLFLDRVVSIEFFMI